MDRLTRAFYATGAAAALSFAAMLIVMLIVAVPGFSVAEDRARAEREAPASVMVGDLPLSRLDGLG